MNKLAISVLFTLCSSLTAFAQTNSTREVNGGVDFHDVYNMGAKENLVKWSAQVHGGLNMVDHIKTRGRWGDHSYNPQWGFQVEYDFTRYWGLGFDYTHLNNDQRNYDNIVKMMSIFASVNATNWLSPYRKWKKINAYIDLGIGDGYAKWENVTDPVQEDDKKWCAPYFYPGFKCEYNFDQRLSFGLDFKSVICFGDVSETGGNCFHPTLNGKNIDYIGSIAVRYKFGGERNIRNTNVPKPVDYGEQIKDQLTMINKQQYRIDSLATAMNKQIENLRNDNAELKKKIKTQQDSISSLEKRTTEAERKLVNPTEDENKLIKASLSDLRFETGKAIIKEESYPSLDKLAKLIKEHNEWNVMLSGYTDNMGNPDKNLKLSRDRAAAVKDYLVGKGVKKESVRSAGYGDKDPIAPNDTPTGRAKNRRVELELWTK